MFESLLGKRYLFLAIFAGVTLTLVGSALFVVSFVYQQTRSTVEPSEAAQTMSLIYVNYLANPDDYISAESYLAMGNYQREYPQPQNIQVLTGLPTVEIIGYMVNHFSGGMGVDCDYCHSLANFAADEWDDPVAMQNKVTARAHLRMTQDLNRNWLTQLVTLNEAKQPSGAQITCATCHNGQPQPNPWPGGISSISDSLRLPLDEEITREGIDILNVNGRSDISLDTVDYHQNVMYYMNVSLNVGCTHCHNSRYFPSWEVPAKDYALNMVQMTQYIWQNYADVMNNAEPSCLMCHQEAVIPPGAARSVAVMPPPLVPEQAVAAAQP